MGIQRTICTMFNTQPKNVDFKKNMQEGTCYPNECFQFSLPSLLYFFRFHLAGMTNVQVVNSWPPTIPVIIVHYVNPRLWILADITIYVLESLGPPQLEQRMQPVIHSTAASYIINRFSH